MKYMSECIETKAIADEKIAESKRKARAKYEAKREAERLHAANVKEIKANPWSRLTSWQKLIIEHTGNGFTDEVLCDYLIKVEGKKLTPRVLHEFRKSVAYKTIMGVE